MRIGFDARILTVPKCGGVAYFARLLKHLPLLDDKIELVLFLPQAILPEHEHFLQHERIRRVMVPEGAKDLSRWPAKHMPRLLREHKIDIYHQPFNADGAFFWSPCPVIVSILDLIPWVIPGIFRKPFKALRYKLRNILWAHTSAKVLTISEASKRDIVRLCRAQADKVVVTLLGADDIYSGVIPSTEKEGILKRLGLFGKKYVVNMGGLNQLRRNPDFILEGFGQYRRETGDDCYLVFTGSILKQDGFFERVQAKMEQLGITERVIITGFLTNKDLKVVLAASCVSVITSLYEGFCLPMTESFCCGVATIANDRGSIPEIAGDAAILVDPTQPQVLSQQLKVLMTDEGRREELKRKGFERAKLFRWENAAQGTLDVYRAVHARKAVR
ncbi:MAG: glycosyltransferase family 4 protein [Candidatus Omnitrophica bacterium]|nr:glycosyltransferase family 4 protein [Candidatus Omnitrophota bacterium]